jgi:cytidine deaminase
MAKRAKRGNARKRKSGDKMVKAAIRIRKKAYSPYSRFQVGAVVRTTDGSIYSGANVENAAYQGTCAESGAIAAMIAAGKKRIVEVVVSGPGKIPCTPCGGCRQRIREFAGLDTPIRVVNERGKAMGTWTLGELLPASFGPENLK